MPAQKIYLLVHSIRSCHNVGSILRSADAFGIKEVIFSGYTPYPHMPNDSRLPHISKKLHAQIQKTALGAEKSVAWRHSDDIVSEIAALKDQGVRVIALEQAPHSVSLVGYVPHSDIALLLGEEVAGIAPQLQALCDQVIEIPMLGEKESLNVSVAAAIAMYQLANH